MTQGSDMENATWPKALLFDLDGTLIDSAPDIAAAVNRLLATQGLEALSVDSVRGMIGNGVRKLVERAFAARERQLDDAGLEAMYQSMMDIYGQHLVNETVVLKGALEVVRASRKSGIRVAVVTNKPEGFSRTILAHYGFAADVDAVVGGDTGPERKPAPDMLLHALNLLNVTVADAVMVGDSPADIGAAKAAGMASVAVRGGYTTVPVEDLGANHVIDTLDALGDVLGAMREPV